MSRSLFEDMFSRDDCTIRVTMVGDENPHVPLVVKSRRTAEFFTAVTSTDAAAMYCVFTDPSRKRPLFSFNNTV